MAAEKEAVVWRRSLLWTQGRRSGFIRRSGVAGPRGGSADLPACRVSCCSWSCELWESAAVLTARSVVSAAQALNVGSVSLVLSELGSAQENHPPWRLQGEEAVSWPVGGCPRSWVCVLISAPLKLAALPAGHVPQLGLCLVTAIELL